MGTNKLNFYRDEPLFGLDIGNSSLKVMQLSSDKTKVPKVLGYGVSGFYPAKCFDDGVIINKKGIGEAFLDLFDRQLVGSITTKRVACTVPSSHTFSRPMKLPAMEKDELSEAVRLEVEQYIPVPIDSLYLDYEISRSSPKEIELLTVAIPKKVIDSYVGFLQTMGLEPVALEPTMNALSRLFSLADPSHDQPSVMVDFGSIATDLAVFDQSMFVNSTVTAGSDTLVNLIAKRLGLTAEKARGLKNEKGINDKSSEILDIIKPILDDLVREIQKIIRYYNERSTPAHRTISQVVLMGGGSTMPGLGPYLSRALGMPARMLDPWLRLDFGDLPRLDELDRSMYLTVAGEAILKPREIFV